MSEESTNEVVDGSATVFETEWFSIVREHPEEMPELNGEPYYLIDSPDSVMVLALTDRQEIVLVQQYRPAAGRQTLELPSGYVGEGESPERAAERELLEETGYVTSGLRPLGRGRIMTNRNRSTQHTFLGTGAVPKQGAHIEQGSDVSVVTLAEFRRLCVTEAFEQHTALALFVLADWKYGLGLRETLDLCHRSGSEHQR